MLVRIKLYLAALAAVVVAFLGAWLAGKREGRAEAKIAAMRDDLDAHERVNDADIGIGASDAANVAWLRAFHDKHSD